jgi:hypothetical protein
MTKKHYTLIASTLNRLYNQNKITDKNRRYILQIAIELSKDFKKQNKRFDPVKFLQIIVP